jgi:hypothetical protein
MPADLALITGLPGGPYRLTITTAADGQRWFSAAEACACEPGGHWHEVVDAPTWQQLVHELLERFLRQEVAT